MKTKRSHEGYFLVDHSESPGIPDQAMPAGMPPRSGQGKFEAPTFTCNHCPRVVMMNPKRNRERAWCRHCDHYICDYCSGILAATGVCKPYRNFLDELQEAGIEIERLAIEKQEETSIILKP